PLFRASPGLWECGNRVVCDFQGLWETRKTCLWFSSFSIARHFHSPFAARISCAFTPTEAGKQLLLFLLHSPRRSSVAGLGCSAGQAEYAVFQFPDGASLSAKVWVEGLPAFGLRQYHFLSSESDYAGRVKARPADRIVSRRASAAGL